MTPPGPGSTRHETVRTPLSWWLVAGELALIIPLSVTGAWMLFFMLPVSVAALVTMGVLVTFPYVRRRMTAEDHFLTVIGVWVGLFILFVFLIRLFGTRPFERLLDWN